MKSLLITLLATLVNMTAFTQSLELSFSKLMEEYKKSPGEFSKNYYSDDFRFLGTPNGKFMNKKAMITLLSPLKVSELSFSDLKFFESGTLGVATGYITIKYNTNTYKDAFTYVFEKRRGQWINVSAQHSEVAYDKPNEAAPTIEAFKTYFDATKLSFIENPVKFFDEECLPDFQYITSKGVVVALKPLRDSFVSKKVLQREITEAVFRPYGTTTMMVTAKMTHRYINTKDNQLTDYGTEIISYMYVKNTKGWKLASSHHSKM